MGLVLKQFKHEDVALWPLIGPFLASREVVKALGGPVFSDPQTTWFVAVKDKEVAGFCSLRESKDGYWLENSYVIIAERGNGMHARLSDTRLKFLATLPPRTVKVCCRMARWAYYEAKGFHQDRVRGDWVYASKLSATPKVSK